MKIKILFLCLLFSCGFLHAQEPYLSVIGNIVNSASYSGFGYSKLGYQIGLTSSIPVYKDFFIEPGLFYSLKRFGYDSENTNIDGNIYSMSFSASSHSLQLPVLLDYRIPMNKSGRLLHYLMIKAGPYVSYGIGGHRTSDDIYFDKSIRKKTYDSDFFRPFDFGLRFGFSFYVKYISFGLGADLGFINISQQPETTIRSNGFHFSLGYNFYLK